MIDARPKRGSPGGTRFALVRRAPRLLAMVIMMITACTQQYFSDSEPIVQTAPPAPRNNCEAAFASRLTDGLGKAEEHPPTPAPDELRPVMDACTGEELLAANDRFAFDSGPIMGRLRMRRLFNGIGHEAQLRSMCAAPTWSDTRACQTVPVDGGG